MARKRQGVKTPCGMAILAMVHGRDAHATFLLDSRLRGTDASEACRVELKRALGKIGSTGLFARWEWFRIVASVVLGLAVSICIRS